MDREYEPNSDDERDVDLDPSDETLPPPTIDPDERIEADAVGSVEEPAFDDDRPA